ncbi:MAG: diacylglycerol/lipid kinase family protein [Gemmatimonadaceae bacterium]
MTSSSAIHRVLLIVNPAARAARRRERLARAAFTSASVSCDVVHTEAAGHATVLAAERSAGYDAVFTLGGDGTAMEVVTALADGGPPVGLLPGGTANVLVRSLGIPLGVSRAVASLLRAPEARIDLGQLGDGRRFAIGVGVGLDACMIEGATSTLKRRLGPLAYTLSAARALWRFERFPVRITVDGEAVETEVVEVLIANFGIVVHGLIRFGDGILHDDGLLNACLFTPRSRLEGLRILLRMLSGRFAGEPRLRYLAGREFTIETPASRCAQADGEILGGTPLHVSVLPGAGRLLVPDRERRGGVVRIIHH